MVRAASVGWKALAGLLLVVMVAACSPGSPTVRTASANDIEVVFTSSEYNGDCAPSSTAITSGTMTNQVQHTATTFTVAINLSKSLCEPINAGAAIYSMPGDGVAWPQTLVAAKPVSLQEAGTTVVTFVKGCDPVQFDVVNGPLPLEITPLNAPPLLFPDDLYTAYQWWGGNCTRTSTTTTTTTTTTIPEPGIPLNNDEADPDPDCPADGLAYWHFVLVPNNGESSFESITLNLNGTYFTFTGEDIVPNGDQTDNVFVAVPDGYSLTDLVAEGSSATYSGATPNQFNLSHICA